MNEGSVEDFLSLPVFCVLEKSIHKCDRIEADNIPQGASISLKLLNGVLGQALKNLMGLHIFPKSFEPLGSVVTVDEIETVVIDGEVTILVDIGLIDLLLLFLEDDLACNEDILVVNVISVEVIQFIFPSLAFEIVGVGEQFGDLGEKGVEER